MGEKKARKSSMITARLSDDDMETLYYLSERIDKPVSDTALRAFKCWMNVGDVHDNSDDDLEQWGKVRKNNRIHIRVTDSEMETINAHTERVGVPISQAVRRAIRAFGRAI